MRDMGLTDSLCNETKREKLNFPERWILISMASLHLILTKFLIPDLDSL